MNIPKKIFIICPVREANESINQKLTDYVDSLEEEGNAVHLPKRDTNQDGTSTEICMTNRQAIIEADEVHVFYSAASTGTHFDMGVAYALGKKIVLVEELTDDGGAKKSFNKLLKEWEKYEEEQFLTV